MDLRCVPVAEADLEAVAGVVNRAFATYPIMSGDRTSAEDYAAELGAGACVLLVETDGRLLATAMVEPASSLEPLGDDHPWKGALYYGLAGVEPEFMNQGLGRQLLLEAERIARTEGYRRMALGTVREFGLVDYYRRFGYSAVHEEPFPAGHWGLVVPHSYVEMVKEL